MGSCVWGCLPQAGNTTRAPDPDVYVEAATALRDRRSHHHLLRWSLEGHSSRAGSAAPWLSHSTEAPACQPQGGGNITTS